MFGWKHKKVKALLPLYGDKGLSPGERRLIEEHLQSCEECLAEWESLRWTVSLLRDVPPVPAPHPFRVRVADLRQAPAPIGFYVARAFTALTAIALILILGLDFLTARLMPFSAMAPAVAPPVTPTPMLAPELPPQPEPVRGLPLAPAGREKEGEVESLAFKSPIPTPVLVPSPEGTPVSAPLPEQEARFPLRWLPLEIALGLGAVVGGVISWILGRRR